jgi:hypothetical protein
MGDSRNTSKESVGQLIEKEFMKGGAYYVYMLCDPITEAPFYIGKGKGDRIFHHEKDNSINKDKINKIKEIGGNILYKIDSFYGDEGESYKREHELISSLEGLTNKVKHMGSVKKPNKEPGTLFTMIASIIRNGYNEAYIRKIAIIYSSLVGDSPYKQLISATFNFCKIKTITTNCGNVLWQAE